MTDRLTFKLRNNGSEIKLGGRRVGFIEGPHPDHEDRWLVRFTTEWGSETRTLEAPETFPTLAAGQDWFRENLPKLQERYALTEWKEVG